MAVPHFTDTTLHCSHTQTDAWGLQTIYCDWMALYARLSSDRSALTCYRGLK